jgi:hypothetical protein
MKEIVLISAYTPELHQIDRLRDLIISLKKFNYRVCLATHTSTPQDIIDRCDYFLYDKENPVLFDPDIKYWHYYQTENYKFNFKDYTSLSSHVLPVLRMYLGALSYLKSLGEEVVHMCEHDTIIKNKEIWDNAFPYLKNHDAVCYTLPRFLKQDGDINCTWTFQSLNLTKISNNYLNYQEQNLINQYKTYFNQGRLPVTECILYDNIWKNLNCYIIPLQSDTDLSTSFTLNLDHSGEVEYSTIHFYNKEIKFFAWNNQNDFVYYDLIIDGKNINIQIPPNGWSWEKISEVEPNIIKIFKNDKLIKHFDMNNPLDKKWIYEYSNVEKL